MPGKRSRPPHHCVYIVELSKEVLNAPRFRKANPAIAGLSLRLRRHDRPRPDVRFDKHKAGIQSNSFVRALRPAPAAELYEAYNPMPYDGARDMEVELAIALREKGYGVWQG